MKSPPGTEGVWGGEGIELKFSRDSSVVLPSTPVPYTTRQGGDTPKIHVRIIEGFGILKGVAERGRGRGRGAPPTSQQLGTTASRLTSPLRHKDPSC
ncbi:hypothetical protein E2C01_001324 [Portunus trituberculatus]|uniref:Uncharacterized protein n=1 Tax=Portunus trituberculatus TaxID=210409 RepID=A0A5B7CHB3_PORTR|nr:hypothetical protein [Portunus trituberculatus]